MQSFNWYNNLNKPKLNPPNWIFKPVWLVLYTMIFISLFIFLTAETKYSKAPALSFFIIQIILNFSWSPIFFGKRNIKGAFLIISLMSIFIFLTILSFYFVSKMASILLIPYFLWVSFATYLNFKLLKLNPVY